jgi:hypothetical protein
MPDQKPNQRLAQPLESLLARLRRRIRAYVWAEGVAIALVVLGLSFWASLGFDWIFEPPPPLRIAVLTAIALVLFYVVYRYILRRAFVRLGDRSMAVLLERRFERLHDSLLTTVELAEKSDHASNFSPEMLAHTSREALSATEGLALGRVFNARPLARSIALSLLLVVSVVAFGVAANEAFGIWVRRSLLLSEELWPRKTHLNVVGFEQGRERRKIARGSDFELSVTADAAAENEVPEIVEIRYTTSDGARGRENMSREGVAQPGRDKVQPYSHTFKGILSPIEFYVVGGDDRRGPLYLDVVDSPTINEMVLHCEYPAYMRRSPRDITVTGLMQIPRGTKLVIEARSNKPLEQVQIDDLADTNTPVTHKLDLRSAGQDNQSFKYTIDRLDDDKTLLFTLHDSDGIHSRDPVRLALSATADESPQVGVSLKGIGTAITSNARLPASGEITDDYGVAKTWFTYHADEGKPEQKPFDADPAGRDKLPVEEELDVAPLKLTPKQKFHVAVEAADAFALTDAPNIGASQRYVLDVVTPEQLRSMLEARELQLRRRFETLLEELTETRDTLARIELSAPTAVEPAPDKPAEPAAAESKPATEKPITAKPGDEPEDAAAADKPAVKAKERTPEQALAVRRVQAERVLQNTERSAHETLGVATAFDDIRAELINNRVDTEELKTRLKDGISDPLRRIGLEMFPELEKRLKKLQTLLGDPASGTTAQGESLRQADAILVEMRQVLDKMLELETFNEVLDLLRGIISSQDKVNTLTKEKQKQKVRNLLEE